MYTTSLHGFGDLPTGPGWNQGVQPVATLGEGGTAVPVAAGDFTIPYTGGVAGGAIQPGIFVNSLGYASQASIDASAAAVRLLDIAKTYGYVSTGQPALTQYASGALVPYLQYSVEQYTPPPNTLNNVAPVAVSITPVPPTSAINPPASFPPVTSQQIANGTTGNAVDQSTFPNFSGATTWLESHWMLIAAGVAAVVILPSLLGGKR